MLKRSRWYHPWQDHERPSAGDRVEFQQCGDTEIVLGVASKSRARKLWIEVDGLIMADENDIERWRYVY